MKYPRSESFCNADSRVKSSFASGVRGLLRTRFLGGLTEQYRLEYNEVHGKASLDAERAERCQMRMFAALVTNPNGKRG